MAFRLDSRLGIVAIIGVIVLLVSLAWVVVAYNGLVAGQQAVLSEWQNVEVQVQRKIDLIPALVGVTGNFTTLEREVIENVTRLRTEWLNTTGLEDRINVTGQIDNLINVAVVVERYPTLHSIWLGQGLMDELAGTENRIAVQRIRYNDVVRAYNTKVRSFPDNVVAGTFGFEDAPYYDPLPGGP